MATKYTKGKDGYFTTRVWDGTYNSDGTKHRKTLRSDKSSKDLENKVNAFKRDVEEHKAVSSATVSFTDYARHWKALYKASARHNTQRFYENIIDNHLSKLSHVNLCDIRRQHLQMLLNESPPSTANHIYLTFKQVIKSAIRDRYLPQSALDDIFADISKPKVVKTEKRALTLAEKDAILNTTLSGREKAYLFIAYGCGLRKGEILALTVDDFKDGLINVNKTIVYDKNKPIVQNATKSDNSNRKVPIPSFAMDFLNEYISACNGMLFPNMTKSAHNNMWRNIKKSIDKAVGYDTKLNSHSLRHNYCSALCYQIPNISIKTIAKLLGDTDKMVIDVYNHIIEEQEDKITAIENALS